MKTRIGAVLCGLALIAGCLGAVVSSPASATLFNWPAGWTNPAGSAQWEDWSFNQCGYVTINGQQWAHLGNDSQGYKSGPVRSIGSGTVRRVINAAAPDNGLMVEYQSTAGPFTLLYQHVTPGLGVGAAVSAGTQIGTVANWPSTTNNHVHVSLIPGPYSSSTSWYGYRNCATGAGSGGGHVNPIPWLTANGPAGGSVSNGSFVSYGGDVYVIAGGAPLYVSSWANVGGTKPTTALSATQFSALRQYPADGTFVVGTDNSVYRFAGGAPLYVSNWANVGGSQPVVRVDSFALEHYASTGKLSHVRQYPGGGTFVSTMDGSVYRFAGGAPLPVLNWANVGGQQPSTRVDAFALEHYASSGKLSHVRRVPNDGTFVTDQDGSVYRFAGGAPVYVSSWSHVGGSQSTTRVDKAALQRTDATGKYSHVLQQPANGTFVSGNLPGDPEHGGVYVFAGGAPIRVSSWANVGGARPVTVVDLAALRRTEATGAWSHVRFRPVDGTVLDTGAAKYVTQAGAPIPSSTTAPGVRVDPVAVANAGGAGWWSHLAAVPVAPVPPTPPPSPTTPTTTTTTPTTGTPVGAGAGRLVVVVKAVRHRSRLRIDVDPDSTSAAYRYVVQRRVDGRWRTITRGRTKGPRDTALHDLRRGTYRVKVPAQLGMSGTSGRVRLRR